jgi:molybdopterin molybdotransferase
MRPMTDLLPVEEAQRLVVERARPLPPEPVPLELAAGRVLAQAARAAVDLPPFASSAMDGFAVRAADTPGRLRVVDRVAAGRPTARAVGAGETIAVATGGVVPEGADAVVPVELVVEEDDEIDVRSAAAAGENVRPRGGDVAAGSAVVGAGTRLTPARLGALAAAGVAEPACTRRARVAVVTTGTELRPPGEQLGPGEVYEANGLLLAAAVTEAGGEAVRLGSVADDERDHRDVLERGLALDVLLTSGGVSVGPHDLVRRIEAELGVEEVFWGVAVKPGKPISFGVRGATLVFGLPGNPVSSLVGFELFVRPALAALHGVSHPLPGLGRGRLAAAVRRNPHREEYLRARILGPGGTDGDVTLDPVVGQESHMIARAASADALVRVPRGDGSIEAGAAVEYLALGD